MKQKKEIHLSESQGPTAMFKEFLNKAEEFVYESEDEGWEKLEKALSDNKIDMDDILENVDSFGSDKTVILFEVARLKGVDDSDLLDAILRTSNLEMTSGAIEQSWDENYVCNVPAETEFEINLHDIEGTIDSIHYPDIYSKLVSKLDEDDVKRMEEYHTDSIIENGIMYVSIPQFYWSLYIDQPKLLNALSPLLRISPEEFKEMEEAGVGGV